MPLLSGISSYGGQGGGDVTVNMETNNLLLNSISFRGIICDEVVGEVVRAKKETVVRPLSATASETYWNVAEEIARVRQLRDLIDITGSAPNNFVSFVGATTLSASYLVGTLQTASQPNITEVGTLSSLNVSGNVSFGGSVAGSLDVTGALTAGRVSASTLTGTLSTALQTNVTRVGTLSQLTVSGDTSLGVTTTTSLTATLGNRLLCNNQTVS